MEPQSASTPPDAATDEQSSAAGAVMPPHMQISPPPAPPSQAQQIAYATATWPAQALAPPHINTESTLAPTSEFMRYLLAAWGSRYLLRGVIGTFFDKANKEEGGVWSKAGAKDGSLNEFRRSVSRVIAKPGTWLHKNFPNSSRESKEAVLYNSALLLGSTALTLSYSGLVYKDIKNIFCETVGAEFDKDPAQVTYEDINRSQNKIVRQTMNNFWSKLAQRAGIDLLFIPAAFMRSLSMGDAVLGGISLQLFSDTWKRKTTMFEDLVTFVNNKINPRNGLGQPIAQGEIFDLYQHYNEKFHPEQMFTNVLERGTGEGAIWATSQPIFARIAELMNQTYAYKHQTVIDPATGHAKLQANFPLPKFVYLLGNDMINTREPERTLATIEIANQYGIPAVKEAAQLWQHGASTAQVLARFPVSINTDKNKVEDESKNGVIAKGSTMQLDAAPRSTIDLASISIAPTEAASLAI